MPNSELPQHQSECLFQGRRELIILHNNETYRLRITKTDKLILTK
ncbi:MAG: hemin uptake protein HemP [Planctomycetia bacterium]|nr:hemin uptake protein HemP [Planctomycetia bacterium]